MRYVRDMAAYPGRPFLTPLQEHDVHTTVIEVGARWDNANLDRGIQASDD